MGKLWYSRVEGSMPSSAARVASAGMIVWYGRLPPASAFGWPGVSSKQEPRFWSVKPHPRGIAAGGSENGVDAPQKSVTPVPKPA